MGEELTGLHYGLSYERYRAAKGVSQSKLKKMLKAPAAAKVYTPQTAAQREGTIAHDLILEPDKFAERYVKAPCNDARLKAYKDCVAANPDKEIVKSDLWDHLHAMRDAVYAHPEARALLENSDKEVSAFWEYPSGLIGKGRSDIVAGDGIIISDLKSCQDASMAQFAKDCANYAYHIQAEYYMQGFQQCGLPAEHFLFLAVEKNPPYMVGLYELPGEALAQAAEKLTYALDLYWECLQNDEWPGLPTGIHTLEWPRWAK
jgi:exodeoxyribonuclease VIII